MNDLVEWLRAQVDEDERVAKRVEPNQALNELRAMVTRDGSAPFLVIDSARVLREVEAKRRILDLAEKTREWTEGSAGATAGYASAVVADTLRLLALPYADRPGYRDEWRPA